MKKVIPLIGLLAFASYAYAGAVTVDLVGFQSGW
jgi:hypothetical protein